MHVFLTPPTLSGGLSICSSKGHNTFVHLKKTENNGAHVEVFSVSQVKCTDFAFDYLEQCKVPTKLSRAFILKALSPSFSPQPDLLLWVGLCVSKHADNKSVFPYTVQEPFLVLPAKQMMTVVFSAVKYLAVV